MFTLLKELGLRTRTINTSELGDGKNNVLKSEYSSFPGPLRAAVKACGSSRLWPDRTASFLLRAAWKRKETAKGKNNGMVVLSLLLLLLLLLHQVMLQLLYARTLVKVRKGDEYYMGNK